MWRKRSRSLSSSAFVSDETLAIFFTRAFGGWTDGSMTNECALFSRGPRPPAIFTNVGTSEPVVTLNEEEEKNFCHQTSSCCGSSG